MAMSPRPKVKGPRRSPAIGDWETRVYITFGATSDPIAQQLHEQGYTIDARLTDVWQRYHSAIVLLKVHQLITRAEGDSAYRRLARLITREIARIDKAKHRHEESHRATLDR